MFLQTYFLWKHLGKRRSWRFYKTISQISWLPTIIFGNEEYGMYVIRADGLILCSDEVVNMLKAYHEKFGEQFICFNYADFQGERGIAGSAAQQYKKALEEALEKDEPSHIESHRYDDFDH